MWACVPLSENLEPRTQNRLTLDSRVGLKAIPTLSQARGRARESRREARLSGGNRSLHQEPPVLAFGR